MSANEEKIKKVIAEQLGIDVDTIKNDSHFIDDLGADSLDSVELMMALEEEFDVEITEVQAEKITTVQATIDFINSNLKG